MFKGNDPAVRRNAGGGDNTFAAVLGDAKTPGSFLAWLHDNRSKTHAKETERILRKDALPVWGGQPIDAITKHDVSDLLKSIVRSPSRSGKRGGGVAANRTLSAVSKMFSWAVAPDVMGHDGV